MKYTKTIGSLNGKVLVFGGVYSNLQALNELMKIADSEGIDPHNVICTGDIVGYCSQPDECLKVIKNWGIHTILGNVEENIRDGVEDCGCNFDEGTRCDMFSRQWYSYALEAVSEEMKFWLGQIPYHIQFEYAGKKILVLHGGLANISEFIFQSTDWDIKEKAMLEAEVDAVLAGHSGIPFSEVHNDKYWLNAGVIGMPANDGTPRVWYMILEDTNSFSFDHKSFEYDHGKTAKLMKENQLPESYAKTLSSGIWDNCEILPDEETHQQGIPLNL